MIYRQNLHTHSVYCDGKDEPEELVKQALTLEFDAIGFSGHVPTAYSTVYHFNKTKEYKAEIARLKEKYRGQIEIYCGMEFDMYSDEDKSGFDYLLGAVHYLKLGNEYVGFDRSADVVKEIIKIHFNGDGLQFAKEYYSQLATLPDYGKFDIVAHFDLITKNIEKADLFDVHSKEYAGYALNALHALYKKIDLFEVNTGAIARGYRTTPYPQKFILQEMNALGCKIILSSDCHDKNYLNCNFAQSLEYIKSCGFNEIYAIKGGKFIGIKL